VGLEVSGGNEHYDLENTGKSETDTVVLLSTTILFRETGFFELISIGL
jgi:hypothetical protein